MQIQQACRLHQVEYTTDMLEGWDAIQRDPDRVEEWVFGSLMQFSNMVRAISMNRVCGRKGLRADLQGAWRWKIACEPAMCPGSLESQLYPELHKMKCQQSVREVVLPPLFCPLDTSPAVQFWVQERHGPYRTGPEESHENRCSPTWRPLRTPLLQRQAEMLHGRLWGEFIVAPDI